MNIDLPRHKLLEFAQKDHKFALYILEQLLPIPNNPVDDPEYIALAQEVYKKNPSYKIGAIKDLKGFGLN